MKLTKELTAKLGLKGFESEQEVLSAFLSKLSDIPVRFQAKCMKDCISDGNLLWSQGKEYAIEYDGERFFADSECNSYGGTYLSKDFLDFFEVSKTTEEVARYMCEEGYGDMFVEFLDPETDRELINEVYNDFDMMI